MELSESDLEVFITAAEKFFAVTAAEPVSTGEARIQLGPPELLDLTGWIEVSGVADGVVCVTADHQALGGILTALGEPEYDTELMADLIGELTGTVVMNAREHFSERLAVSTPTVFTRDRAPEFPENVSFVVPLIWQESELFLIIAIQRTET